MDKYNEYVENRFKYLKELSNEELLKEKEELEEELYDIENREVPSQAKTERENDKYYAEEKLWYINNLLKENKRKGR